MKERTQDRLFAACGIASAVLVHVGLFVGLASGQAFVNLGSSPTKVAHELAKPAGTGVWVGAYLGLLGFGVFLAFAVWATAKLGGGLLGAIARTAATAYASVSIAALCVFDAVEFRAGHGMGTQLATALTNINEALYVGSWFLSAFFLLPAGALALQSGRRALGWGAIAIALLSLAGAAAPANSLAENAVLLWFIWIIWASISLARVSANRRERSPSPNDRLEQRRPTPGLLCSLHGDRGAKRRCACSRTRARAQSERSPLGSAITEGVIVDGAAGAGLRNEDDRF